MAIQMVISDREIEAKAAMMRLVAGMRSTGIDVDLIGGRILWH